MKQVCARLLAGTLPFLALGLAWEAVSRFGIFPPYFFPAPGAVLSSFVRLLWEGGLLQMTGKTLATGLLGFLMGSSVALGLATLCAFSRRAEEFFFPLVSVFYPIPGIVWVPLALLWFRFSPASVVFVVALAAFFQVFYTALTGIKNINPVYVRAAQSLGIRGFGYFREIILLGTLPFLLTGIRLAVGASWRVVVGAEMLAATVEGLGWFLWQSTQFFQYVNVYASILTIGLVGVLLEALLIRQIERRTVGRWQEPSKL